MADEDIRVPVLGLVSEDISCVKFFGGSCYWPMARCLDGNFRVGVLSACSAPACMLSTSFRVGGKKWRAVF